MSMSTHEADIRAAVERETAGLRRVNEELRRCLADTQAELDTVKRQMGIECEGRHKAEAEVERLKGEVERARENPAKGKSLANMIAEASTLAMGQQTAALETMIREFLQQTGAKVEDCVLVEQMEDTKMTWRIEHRPKGEGGET